MRSVCKPVHEAGCLVSESEAEKGVDRKGGIADPCVAVVPIAGAADDLGQTGGGSGDDRSRGLEGKKFESQGRALYLFAPASAIGTGGEPLLPKPDGALEQILGLLLAEEGKGHGHLQDEPSRGTLPTLPSSSRNSARHLPRFSLAERHRRGKREGQAG